MANTTKPTPKKPQVVEVINPHELSREYANYVSVNTGRYECNITFCHIEPENVTPSKIKAIAVSKVMIPVELVEDTLKAIATNYEKAIKNIEQERSKRK